MGLLFTKNINQDTIHENIFASQEEPLDIFPVDVMNDDVGASAIPKHWHRALEFVIPQIGRSVVFDEGRLTTVAPGEVYMINSRHIHALWSPEDDEEYHGWCIQVSADYIESIAPGFLDCAYASFYDSTQSISYLCGMMIAGFGDDSPEAVYQRKGFVHFMIYELLKTQSGVPVTQLVDKNMQLIVDVLNYIDAHYKEDISVQDLAARFYVSYGHLAKVFKIGAGMSVKAYITARRLAHARHLLEDPKLSVTEIALESGFPNVKSFETTFRKDMGETPRSYRQKYHL